MVIQNRTPDLLALLESHAREVVPEVAIVPRPLTPPPSSDLSFWARREEKEKGQKSRQGNFQGRWDLAVDRARALIRGPRLLGLSKRKVPLRALVLKLQLAYTPGSLLGVPHWCLTGHLTLLTLPSKIFDKGELVTWPIPLSRPYSFPEIWLASRARRSMNYS